MPTPAERRFRRVSMVLLLVIAASCMANVIYAVASYNATTAAREAADAARDNGADLRRSSARRECANQVTAKYDEGTAAVNARDWSNIVELILLAQAHKPEAHRLALDMKAQAQRDKHRPPLTALINEQCPAPLASVAPSDPTTTRSSP